MKNTMSRVAIAIVLGGFAGASFGEDKMNMFIIMGNGAASEYTQKAVLRDPSVVALIGEDFYVRMYNAEQLDFRYYAIKNVPAVLVFGRDRSIFRHEGSFRSPGDFIAFALAAKLGMTVASIGEEAAVVAGDDGSVGE